MSFSLSEKALFEAESQIPSLQTANIDFYNWTHPAGANLSQTGPMLIRMGAKQTCCNMHKSRLASTNSLPSHFCGHLLQTGCDADPALKERKAELLRYALRMLSSNLHQIQQAQEREAEHERACLKSPNGRFAVKRARVHNDERVLW